MIRWCIRCGNTRAKCTCRAALYNRRARRNEYRNKVENRLLFARPVGSA